jgi:hypothetical protein
MNILVSAVLGKLIQSTQIDSVQIQKKFKFKTCTVFKTYIGFKLISQYLNNITISQTHIHNISTISQTHITISQQYHNNNTTIQFNNQIVIHNVDHQFNNQIVNIHKHCFLVHQFNSV